MALRRFKPLDPPVRELGWLVVGENCTAMGYAACQRALKDEGILEVPLGSNRGPRLDRYAKEAGSPLGSWWCAILAGRVLIDIGSVVPERYGATNEWLPFIRRRDQGATPLIGDVVIYGTWDRGPIVPWGYAHHAGIIVRLPERQNKKIVQPLTLTIEGNRGYAGTTNNGVAVDMGPMIRTDVLGYFTPREAA